MWAAYKCCNKFFGEANIEQWTSTVNWLKSLKNKMKNKKSNVVKMQKNTDSITNI